MVCLSENMTKTVPSIPVTSFISVTADLVLQSHFSGFKAFFLSLALWPTRAEGKQVRSYAAGATTPGKHCITERVLSTGRSGEKIILLISLGFVKLRCCLQR